MQVYKVKQFWEDRQPSVWLTQPVNDFTDEWIHLRPRTREPVSDESLGYVREGAGMRAAQIHKRLQTLSAKVRPNRNREFTFEELCRECWRRNKRAFLALANRDCPGLRVFVGIFQREDAERVLRANRGGR
jgi:hypothetical protein